MAFIENKQVNIDSGKIPQYIDLKSLEAHMATSLLVGVGVNVSTKNKKIDKFLNDYIRDYKFNDFLFAAIYDSVYSGGVIFTLDRTLTGEVLIRYVKPGTYNNVFKVNITPFRVEIHRKQLIGKQSWYINEVYDKKHIFRNVKLMEAIGGTTYISPYESKDKIEIPKELALPQKEVHNLGFVPFEEWLNRAVVNDNNTWDYSNLADDYNVREIPTEVNRLIHENSMDSIINKPLFFGNFSKQELSKFGNQASIKNLIESRTFFTTKDHPNQSKPVEAIQGQYDGTKYLEPIERLINIYFMGCKLSDVIPKSADMTQAETLLSKDLNQRTTKEKRQRLMDCLNNLFSKLLVMSKIAKDYKEVRNEFTIEIKENVIYNRLQLTQFLIQNIEAGLMSRKEAIGMARDIDNDKEIEAIIESIDQERDADLEKINENMAAQQQAQAPQDINNQGQAGDMGALGADQDQEQDMFLFDE